MRRYRWVVLNERKGTGGLAGLLGLRTVQSLLHCLDAFYDFIRYLRFFTPLRPRARERRRLEALLFLHLHKIEKTLALPEPPELFGTSYLGALLDLLDTWAKEVGDFQAVAFRAACRALCDYRRWVGDRLEHEFHGLAGRLERQLDLYDLRHTAQSGEGTRQLTATELRAAVEGIDFERLARLRHSVRNFAPDPIPDEVIARAVRIAQQTPSVCNRQAWRVHVYTAPEDKETVLRMQDGNAGFGHLAARVLLISADIRVYVTSGERHQAYVDGGMFAMTLVYALQADGIVSCCLNLCNYFFQDVAVHRVCRIPPWEIPIMMIAIGYPAAEYRVATSARLDTESILQWRVF
jgi:nitroreductase